MNEPACASDVQPTPQPATDDDPYYRSSACGYHTPSARLVDPMMGGVSRLGLLLLARRVSKRRRG